MGQTVKAERIGSLKEILEGAKSVVLSDFTGLNVKDISELRRICRSKGITFHVVKNTLAKRGMAELGMEGLAPLFEGPTAIAVSTADEVLPAQILKKFADDYELPRIKGAYVGGRVYSAQEVIRLAQLPPRDVLIAQVVGTMQAPLRGIVVCLGASLRDLASVLSAIADKKKEAA